MCGKCGAGFRLAAGPPYYKRMRHLAIIVSLALVSGHTAISAASTRVAPAALPFAISWTHEYPGTPPVAAAVSEAGWLVAGFPDHLEIIALDSGDRVGNLPLPATRLACDGTMCVAGDDTMMRAIDLTSRTARWQKPTPGPLAFPPTLRNGWVFLTTTAGRISAQRATDGAELWSFAADAPLSGPLSVDGDRIALATTNDTVAVLDVRTGRAVWSQPIFSGRPGAPRIGGGVVYVGTENRDLLFLDVATGRQSAPQRLGATIVGAPALDERLVYTTGQDGVLRAFDRGSRSLKWYANLPTRPSATGPSAGDNLAIVALRNGSFQAFLSDGDGKKAAAILAAPGIGDNTVLLQVPPIIAGAGRGTRLVTISVNVGDSSKWSATLMSGGGTLSVSAVPASVSGLGLTLTPPR